MNNIIIKGVQIIVACVLVGALIMRVDWEAVYTQVIHMRGIFVVAFVLLYIIGIGISAWKWYRIAQINGFDHSYYFYFRTYILGTFLNNFFPSFVGGDAYRTIALARGSKRRGDSFATIVIDRISGLLVIVVLMLVCSGLRYDVLYDIPMMSAIYASAGIGVLCVIIGVWMWRSGMLRSRVSFISRRLAQYFAIMRRCDLRRVARPSIVYAVVFSFIGIAAANYMLFMAIGAPLTLWDYISVIFLTNLIASVPVSMGNIGTKEWAYVFLFGLFGVAGSTAVAVVLVSRVLQMIISCVALPLYIHDRSVLKKI